ncbi:MAG: matrixin family metalloprotease, partial [Rhodobacteraceae bacterium]|nr:matrixin family metalloprotease [Paracoccaceae bacterium]
ISIHPFTANKKLVLEHELGHALGWRHYNQKMHIMFPRYESLGNHSQDVRYSDYLYHQKTSSSE